MNLRFWGVRGGMPLSGASSLVFGGNTSCVEVRCGPYILILDAGSGLQPFGHALRPLPPITADLLLTHTHFDHICGLPFFAPMFRAGSEVVIRGGHLPTREALEAALTALLTPPLMPDLIAEFRIRLDVRHIQPGAGLNPRPGVVVETAPLNHPGGAVGYRISADGSSIAYLTDTEHPPTGFDPNVVRLARGADVMIYDTYFEAEDYARHIGWGHSTWQHAIELADHACVRTLVLFHHNLYYDDARLGRIAEAAEMRRPGTIVAREGLCLVV